MKRGDTVEGRYKQKWMQRRKCAQQEGVYGFEGTTSTEKIGFITNNSNKLLDVIKAQ